MDESEMHNASWKNARMQFEKATYFIIPIIWNSGKNKP